MSRLTRQQLRPNPYADHRPYPDEPARSTGGDGRWGQNMYSQGGQSNRGSTRMPWPEGAPSDGAGDDEDRRSRLPRGYRRGDGSSGRYE